MNPIKMARIKEDTPPEYYRVLVDRLWPRGISKDQTWWDEWLPEVAPSTELRHAYHSDIDDSATFRVRYLAELGQNMSRQMARLAELARTRPLALLTYSRTLETSHVPILRDFLEQDLT